MANQDNARQLLERLANDESFRSLMEQSPVEAFSEYGFHIDPEIAPDQVVLPSKEEIEADLDLMAEQIVHTLGFILFKR